MSKHKTNKNISTVVYNYISKDTFAWFNKLTLVQKLKCIEEQIKFWYFFIKNSPEWKKRIYKKY
ncbi:MAG: hypothetical protein N2Z73_01820 [Endomicrobia bacterium]|nr:hypothetical protein [Endomicrobiia bacterium]